MATAPYTPGEAAGVHDGRMLDMLISLARANLSTSPSSNSVLSKPAQWRILYQALWTRYEAERKVDDLEEALGIGIMLASRTHTNTVERGFFLDALGCQMSALYEQSALMVHLDVGISLAREAVKEPVESDLDLSKRLASLGYNLAARFRAARNPTDLAESIEIGIRALDATPEAENMLRLKQMSNLSARYIERYHRDHNEEDKLEAERLCNEIISSTTPEDQHRAVALANLSDLYMDDSACSSSSPDVEESIRLVRFAVGRLKPDAQLRGQILAKLGSRLYTKYQQTEEIKYLDEAIALYDEATSSPSNARLDLLIILTKFARFLKEASEQTRAGRIIDKAISVYLTLVDVPEIDHESRQDLLRSLRTLYNLKFS